MKKSIKRLRKRLNRLKIDYSADLLGQHFSFYLSAARNKEREIEEKKKAKSFEKTVTKMLSKKNKNLVKKGRSNQRVRLDIESVAPKDRKKVISFISKIPEKRLVGKELTRFKKRTANLLFTIYDQKVMPSKKVSVRKMTTDTSDLVRINRGKTSYRDQMYYNNFVLATLRTGNYDMYKLVMEGGEELVIKLLANGFEIREVYVGVGFREGEDYLERKMWSDKELEKMGVNLSNPSSRVISPQSKIFFKTDYNRFVYEDAIDLIKDRKI